MPRSKKQPGRVVVLCACSCPYWGDPRVVYECECECGSEINVCGDCLRAGRVTACPECSPKSRSMCPCCEDRED
jgi:hypothetical protein